MPRKPFIQSLENPYHITSRCQNREWFNIPIEKVWSILCAYLYLVSECYGLKIHAFVLMNNHFHLIVSAPMGNLSEAMQYFLRETSRAFSYECKRINQLWGGRFHRSEISKYHYYLAAYKYLYRNPVEAGLANSVTEYPFSTLSGLIGNSKLLVPVVEDLTLFSNFESTLKWLDQAPSKENLAAVRNALRNPVFKLAKQQCRKHKLETDLF